jgi:hypothetical protein
LEFDRPPTELPEKNARFVIWNGSNVVDEAGELHLLLEKLGLHALVELQGLAVHSVQPSLREETSFFLDYTGVGKLCVAVPHIRQRKEGFPKDIRDHSIVTLRLSVRASNCLKSAGVQTIAELMRWTPDDLLDLPSMGKKTLDELLTTLVSTGISSSSSNTPFQSAAQLSSSSPPALAEEEFFVETLLTLSQSGISEHLVARLNPQGIRTLGDLAQCRPGKLRVSSELVSEELVELANTLRRHGLHWGMVLPPWHKRHAEELSAAFALEIVDSIQNASIWSSQLEIPPPITEVADSLTEELETLFPKRADERDRMIVKACWGLNGDFPLTLEGTAQRYELTRERVRQICKPFYHSLVDYGRHLPWLQETLNVLKDLSPCLAEEAEAMLVERRIVNSLIRVESLLQLVREAGIDHTLVVEGERRLLLDAEMVDGLKTVISYTGKMVSHWGVAEKNEVLTASSFPPPAKIVNLILDAIPDMVWLDTEKTFLWVPTAKSAVENRLLSILRVAPDIALHEAYEGVVRDGRVTRERLPFRIFSAFCQRYPWWEVKADRLVAASGLPQGERDSHADIVVGFLRETSGIGWRDDLWKRAQAAGIGKPSFDRLLSDSSVIVRHAVSLYGLIGTAAPEIQEELPIEVHEPVSNRAEDEGENGTTLADTAGIFSGLNPRSRLFPFQVLGILWGKSTAFESSWSVAELQLTHSDVEAIRLWGRFGALDMRRDIRKTELIGRLNVRGIHAISLTFLLFCSEIAREDGIEGELWPTVKLALDEPMRQALLGRMVVPKAVIRDGTEDVCRILRIRHVFGREGEQSWLRTVFLQFGFTRRGINGIDRWLVAREHVPVAVEDLLDSSRGLKSESFAFMWQTLQELRWRTIDTSKAAHRLKNNPWLRLEDQALAFTGAQSSRNREAVDEEATAEEHYSLLVDRRLRLVAEPSFEFRLNPIPPPWCDGERYTLELGQQRLPVSRNGEGWAFDHSQFLSIPLSATAVEVDLTQRRQSVLGQTLLLRLLPTTEIGFFDLGSGAELELGQVSTRVNRGTVILHRSSAKVHPDAPEFVAVFDGSWRLSVFRQGLPEDLTLMEGDQFRWQPANQRAETKSVSDPAISVRIENGWWGNEVEVSVACSVRTALQPKTLIVDGQTISLTLKRPGEWRGKLSLRPKQNRRETGDLFCEEDGWIRRRSVAISAPQSAGVAVEGEDGWITLTNASDVDVRWLRGRRTLVRPPTHEGQQRELKEWALLEGDRLVSRPRHNSEPLQGLEALGEELSLAYGPYNNYEPWHSFARSVTDSGCIRTVRNNHEGQWTIEITESIGLGVDHALWIWRLEDSAPERLDRCAWEEADGQIVCRVSRGTVLGFALSFQEVLLGSRSVDDAWTGLRSWIENCKDWKLAAEWLRWWRIPVRHPQLREFIEARARRHPLETLRAWLTDSIDEDGPRYLESNEESWQSMTRICLWGWRPNAPESAHSLKSLDLWNGDFQHDAECENFDFLLATNPMLLAQMARKGAPLLYEGAPKRELAALIRCLRNRILEPRDGVRWQDAYNATCLSAATDLNVDDRFLQKSVVEDARRYVRGDLKDQRNLKLALGSMLLRRIVGSRLLEETAEEWTRQ